MVSNSGMMSMLQRRPRTGPQQSDFLQQHADLEQIRDRLAVEIT